MSRGSGRCPACAGVLAPVRGGGEEARRCPGCGSLWLEPATLARLTAEAVEPGAALPEGVPPSRQWAPPKVKPDEVGARRYAVARDIAQERERERARRERNRPGPVAPGGLGDLDGLDLVLLLLR